MNHFQIIILKQAFREEHQTFLPRFVSVALFEYFSDESDLEIRLFKLGYIQNWVDLEESILVGANVALWNIQNGIICVQLYVQCNEALQYFNRQLNEIYR